MNNLPNNLARIEETQGPAEVENADEDKENPKPLN